MTKKGGITKLGRCRRRGFRAANGGGTTVMFALLTLPVLAIIGAAVDYSRASAMRAAMQAAVDTTALAIAANAASDSGDQLNSSAATYFNALFARPDAQNVQVGAAYSSSGGRSVVVNASANMKTNFMAVFGVSNVPISASGTAAWGMSRLRVALVLDNAASMADAGKLAAMKTAAKNLIAQLRNDAVNPGDVYVSIVPFNKDVNVGPANYTLNWISWKLWDLVNGVFNLLGVVTNHNTWNGCIMDRDQNYDVNNTLPNPSDINLLGSIASTLFPAEQYTSCPVQLMPLSSDWTALNAKIDAMTASGATNQSIGLAWGWQSLSPGSPLNAPAEDPGYKYQKVIILLSDGLNTQNRWTSDSSQIDARQQLVCGNIKAAGITLYTVQINTGGAATSTVLKNCASDTGKWFVLNQANQIIPVFGQIGMNLSQLHMAK
jgi:Flp pilus assembly protein TadG